MVLLQVQEGLLDLLGTLVGKALQVDVAHLVALHAIPGDLFHLNLFAHDLHFPRLLLARTLDEERHLRVGHPFQQFAHLVARELRDIGRVDLQDQVACLQSGQGGWHPFVRLGNHHPTVRIPLTDVGADTPIFAGRHHLECLHLLFGNVFRIGIEPVQHGVDAPTYTLLYIDRIHIKHLHLLDQGIEDVQILTHLKAVVCLGLEG